MNPKCVHGENNYQLVVLEGRSYSDTLFILSSIATTCASKVAPPLLGDSYSSRKCGGYNCLTFCTEGRPVANTREPALLILCATRFRFVSTRPT